MKRLIITTFLILIAAFWGVFQFTVMADIPAAERQALIDLYNATDGDHWANKEYLWKNQNGNFKDPGTENTWYGVKTDAANTTVISIDLHLNNLVGGPLPNSLSSLSSLESLDLYINQITGSIPAELGNLSQLVNLGLNNNQLTGSIPKELGNLSQLRNLYLGPNQLTGSIPAELGNLSQLNTLFFTENQLTGSIPKELGSLSQLGYLDLGHNQLTGSIPKELGNLSNLIWLHLSNNQLTGSIPKEFGNLNDLMILELNRNHLTGSIPVELPNYLKNLTKFNLSGNMFASEIPFDLTGMYNLDPSKTDIGYNALMAVDAKLINFLNNKDPDWADTQTVAPIYVDASMPSLGSVLVSWIPILYTADSGGYNVYYSYYSGGPYTKAGSTSSKSDSSFLVTGLPIDSTYYFVVQAFTNPHIHNDNLVQSMYSDEASCTVAGAQPWKTGTSYKTGDFVIYSGKTWRCTYGHSSQTDWHPGAAGITFWVLTDANGQWQSGMAYKVGDVVQYKGVKWRCAYAHTSQVDWYPGAPGLWFWKKI